MSIIQYLSLIEICLFLHNYLSSALYRYGRTAVAKKNYKTSLTLKKNVLISKKNMTHTNDNNSLN